MIALGIDTSSRAGSVGLVEDGDSAVELTIRSDVTHSARILAAVDSVLAAAGRRAADLDLLAVASGPGSFTGLRIGMATAKGLAIATGRPLVGFSTLETIAVASAPISGAGLALPVCVIMDAGRGEVYRGVYRIVDRRPQAVGPEEVIDRSAAASGLPEDCLICGDGIAAFGASLPALPPRTVLLGATPAIGAALGRRALALAAEVGVASLPPLTPNYIRIPDAEANLRG